MRRAACPFLLLLLTACGSGEKLYRVSGTVNYDGKPVPKGLIFFDPDGGGPQGFANVVDGKFDTAQQGKGVRGGSYTLRVNGYDGKQANEAPFGKPLFAEHQEKRELPQADSELMLDLKKK